MSGTIWCGVGDPRSKVKGAVLLELKDRLGIRKPKQGYATLMGFVSTHNQNHAERRRDMYSNAEILSERVQRDGFLQPPVTSTRQLAVCDRTRERTCALSVCEDDRESAYPFKMWRIRLSENYSILGDKEEVEDEADEAGKVSSATEKSKEDPIEKAITIKLDDLSGNTFVKFLEAYRALVDVQDVCGILDGTSEEMTVKVPRIQMRIFTSSWECVRGARFLGIDFQCNTEASFKDTLIVSTNCGHGGYWDNKVKVDREDLSRDILKSETCGLTIPKIDLAMQPGTLGGRSTIVEAFSELSYEELSEKEPSTLLLNDPLANLYLQNLYLRDPDLNMEIVVYERKWRRSEELGLNDMKVEN
ncbi:hypothetical protein EDD15DRAFT_2193557 [Pisolithus albus]|nr:hypothetical protein EDD15DRAFT_2193557 [Pisolithus albus]